MLVDLIDKLIDRCIQLINYDKQRRKDLYENWVAPIFAAFEAVHKDYLESFERYREKLQSPNQPVEAVLDMIRRDNLFTADQRAKLKALAEVSDDAAIAPFLRYIHLYLTSPDFYGTSFDDPKYRPYSFRSQRWRQGLLHEKGKRGQVRS